MSDNYICVSGSDAKTYPSLAKKAGQYITSTIYNSLKAKDILASKVDHAGNPKLAYEKAPDVVLPEHVGKKEVVEKEVVEKTETPKKKKAKKEVVE